MCGIAGLVQSEPGVIAPQILGDRLRAMADILRHRGPDASGIVISPPAGLAHTRLSIIDLAGGSQPMSDPDGSLTLVFNGEIFNYLELREELAARGRRFVTQSDTEVILHLYDLYGSDCVHHLNGQWALAIWDARRRRLFLSRDRHGVRPLFYTFAGKCFLFASEIKALFTHPDVPRRLNVNSLSEIFTLWHCLPPATAFEGIEQLPPGHSALLENGSLQVTRYWQLDFSSSPARPHQSVEESADRLRDLLEDATRLRLRADVPVGAYLSGGLDSTVVAALAKRLVPHRLRTFSVRFDDPDFDEGSFQNDAIRHLGVDHQEFRCSDADIGRAFPRVVWHAETPVLRTAPAPLFLLSQAVRAAGFKVVLTGEGSDEMLGGYDLFKEFKIRRFMAAHPESSLRPLLLKRLYPYLRNITAQPPSYLQAFFHSHPDEIGHPLASHHTRWRLTSGLKLFLSPQWKARLNGHTPDTSVEALLPEEFPSWDPFHRAQYLEAAFLMPGYILSSQGDRVAMAHSIEGRFPFLDPRIAEYAASLPPQYKMHVLCEKYLLKKCATGLVPASVASRTKQPYRAPDAKSFFPGGRPMDYVAELLHPDRLRNDGVFDPQAVSLLIQKARQGRISGLRDNMAVVGILSTQLLVHQFVNHFSPEVPTP